MFVAYPPVDCRVGSLESSAEHHQQVCLEKDRKHSQSLLRVPLAVHLDVPPVPPTDKSSSNANISRLT